MSRGITILDEKDGVIIVKLQDIFQEIFDGNFYKWSLLFFSGRSDLIKGKNEQAFQHEVNKSERGLLVSWEELNFMINKFIEVTDILILGCKSLEMLRRYENDQEMYESCDFVIEMIDSYSWEVFSTDINFIERLSKKFKEIKFLESDFQDEWLKKDSS